MGFNDFHIQGKNVSETILPCPFCGEGDQSFEADQGDKWGHVICGCGACGPEVRTGYDVSVSAKWHKESVKEWNTRSFNKAINCTGCKNAPQKQGDNYDLACLECKRFYADHYEQ